MYEGSKSARDVKFLLPRSSHNKKAQTQRPRSVKTGQGWASFLEAEHSRRASARPSSRNGCKASRRPGVGRELLPKCSGGSRGFKV